jgi:hypothetical protein
MNASSVRHLCKKGILILTFGMISALGQPLLQAGSAESYGFAHRLPAASLADPAGKNWTLNQNNGQPTLVIVSVPDMSQGNIQQGWVTSQGSLSKQVNFYLVEDMRNAFFRSIALSDMKKDFAEGDRPVVLIDNDGSVRAQLGAPRGKTCVMVYNANNRLVYVQVGNPSAAAVQAVNKVVAGLLN